MRMHANACMHLFLRTRQNPRIFYFCVRSKSSNQQSRKQSIDLDISDGRNIPIACNWTWILSSFKRSRGSRLLRRFDMMDEQMEQVLEQSVIMAQQEKNARLREKRDLATAISESLLYLSGHHTRKIVDYREVILVTTTHTALKERRSLKRNKKPLVVTSPSPLNSGDHHPHSS